MSQIIFRNKVINNIENALSEFEQASQIDHPGLQGEIREIAAKNLFKPLLPEGFKIQHRGKVVDSWGNQSKEIDLIIYSKNILPAIMYGEKDFLFPAESSFYAIEVKSRITAGEIKNAHEKAKNLLTDIKYLSGIYEDNLAITHRILKILPVLFAFTSDLSEGGKSEIQRYQDYLLNSREGPQLIGICVVGRGYWWYKEDISNWFFHGPTKEYDEVIDFLSGVMNTLHKSYKLRGNPRLGSYLMLENRGGPI